MGLTIVSMGVVLGMTVGVVALAIYAGRSVYGWLRTTQTRPLTEEEKWQETSVESLSEDEWSALIASLESKTIASHEDATRSEDV